MIVGDGREACLGGRLGAVAAKDGGRGIDVVEQGREPFFEQRQPMVHARLSPSVADRLIQRIARRLPAEQVAIRRTEALDRRFVEQGFGCGEQLQRLGGAEAALVGGVEAANALDLVAEEIDAQARLFARGKQVEDAAAHCELALVGDGVDAAEAVRDEQFGERVAVDPLPRGERRRELADAEGGEGALGDRGDGGEDEFAALCGQLQRGERRKPVRTDAHRRARAVVRQTVPRRKTIDDEVGREEGRRVGDRLHRAIVGRHIDEALVARPREIGEQQRQETVGGARQRQRRRRRSDRGKNVGGGHRHGSGI